MAEKKIVTSGETKGIGTDIIAGAVGGIASGATAVAIQQAVDAVRKPKNPKK